MMPDFADKTIGNMEEMLAANKKLEETEGEDWHYRQTEKQRLHVEASMARCRRCGDFAPAFPVAGILTRICNACEAYLKEQDGCMWFVDMVDAVSKKDKGS